MDRHFIRRCFAKNGFKVTVYAILGLAVWFIAFIVHYITGRYIDRLIYSSSKDTIYFFTGIVLAVNVFSIAGSYFQNLIGAKLHTKMAFEISCEVYESLKRVPLSYYKDVDPVYLVSKINDDSNVIVEFILSNMISILSESLTFVLGTYIVYRISPLFSMVVVCVVPVYIFVYLKFKNRVYDSSYAFKESQNKYFSAMTEQFLQIKYLKTHGLSDFFSQRLKRSFKLLFDEMIKNFKATYILNNFNMIITLMINIFIIFYAGSQIIEGNMTIGSFTIISTYFSNIVAAITFFMALGSAYQEMNASRNRLMELVDIETEHNGSVDLKEINQIVMRSVTFAYDSGLPLFKNLSIQLDKGKIYGIKGSNGTGKSTFVNVLIGLYQDDYTGDIFYDNINIHELDMYRIRKNKIAISDQEPQLLNSSIIGNLILDRPDIEDEDVDNWCKRFGICSKIVSLDHSSQADTAEMSLNLSGGEKQKISLIRAFLKNAPLVILDEPTSALDIQSANTLTDVLEQIKKDKIIIVVTHDEKLLRCTDCVIDIDSYK